MDEKIIKAIKVFPVLEKELLFQGPNVSTNG